jgi:CPA1 family monovalent cation:H+ antiporter
MSDVTAEYIDKFWELIDEILNAVLFVLIGLELLIIKRTKNSISFHHSFISNFSNTIYICLYTIHCCAIKEKITKTLLILTWGGLRGSFNHLPYLLP